MKIFVSWSGMLSHRVALLLRNWLPCVMHTVELYVSSEDIEKGQIWFDNITSELEEAEFGIVCLTHENMASPWILFESGAISKSINKARVIPLLIDLSLTDLKGPLVYFQAMTTSESDMRKLVTDINSNLGSTRLDDTRLERSFAKWWPDFKNELEAIVQQAGTTNEKPEKRGEREILEEVLELTRTITRSLSMPKPKLPPLVSNDSLKSIFKDVKASLGELGKHNIIQAIDEAAFIAVKGNALYFWYEQEKKHFAIELAKPENKEILSGVCLEASGLEAEIAYG